MRGLQELPGFHSKVVLTPLATTVYVPLCTDLRKVTLEGGQSITLVLAQDKCIFRVDNRAQVARPALCLSFITGLCTMTGA